MEPLHVFDPDTPLHRQTHVEKKGSAVQGCWKKVVQIVINIAPGAGWQVLVTAPEIDMNLKRNLEDTREKVNSGHDGQ